MSAEPARPWHAAGRRLVLRVRLTPRSSKDAIEGTEETADGPAIKARVRAVPSDGEANAAVERLLADWLGVPRRSVAVTGGHKSRVKLLTVAGDPDMLERRLIETLVQHDAGKTA